jgi:hypothetical protein
MLALFLFFLTFWIATSTETKSWSSQTYPSPRTNFTACGTWLNSTLCDPDSVLTDDWRKEIDINLKTQISSNFFSYKMIFLIVNHRYEYPLL